MQTLRMKSSQMIGCLSATSLQAPQNSKIDSIITKLQSRKNQLLCALEQKSKICPVSLPPEHQGNNSKQSMNDCILKTLQRRQKYLSKIQFQMSQINRIQTQHRQRDARLIELVIALENQQINLKNLSQEAGSKFDKAFAFKYFPGCENSKKYTYQRIFQLQSLIEDKNLKLRTVLCKFYMAQNSFCERDRFEPPQYFLIDYVISQKLVNKLYGFVLQYQSFRKRPKTNQSSSIIQPDVSQQNSICQEHDSLDEQLQQYTQKIQKASHDAWMQILKLLKNLQKSEPISGILPIQSKIQQQNNQCAKNLSFGIQINTLMQKCLQLRSKIKQLSNRISCIRQQKQQMTQQIKIKQELILSYKVKIDKIEREIEQQQNKQSQNQNKNISNIEINPEKDKIKVASQKQLKQIDQAIRYFNIKKMDINSKDICRETTKDTIKNTLKLNAKTKSQLKTMEDLPSICSPQKRQNMNNFDKFMSPEPNMVKTRNNSNTKYSLKNLLSPPKQMTTLQKRKAWK